MTSENQYLGELVIESWKFPSPAVDVSLSVERNGLVLRSDSIACDGTESLNLIQPLTRLGELIPGLVPQLLQLGLAELANGVVCVPHSNLDLISENGIDAFEDLAQPAPFMLSIESTGSLGLPDFKYSYELSMGRSAISFERIGCFVRWNGILYRLDQSTYQLIEAMDRHNCLEPQSRIDGETLLTFAQIKGLVDSTGTQIDAHIKTQRVIVASALGVRQFVDKNNTMFFLPTVPGCDNELLARAFLLQDAASDTYSLTDEDGQHAFVIFSEDQREALRRMRLVRRVGGAERELIERQPEAVFDGVLEVVDLSEFGPRVEGIGAFPYLGQMPNEPTGIYKGIVGESEGMQESHKATIVRASLGDGDIVELTLKSRKEILRFCETITDAFDANSDTVDYEGVRVVLNEELREQVAKLITRDSTKQQMENGSGDKRYILPKTNLDKVDYTEEGQKSGVIGPAEDLPRSLLQNKPLKGYQLDGFKWLRRRFLAGERGCFLADDMGLGKTLQVLTFLARYFEDWQERNDKLGGNLEPPAPVLIIAPLMLVENNTWEGEMREFFANEGNIFLPILSLHGRELSNLRSNHEKELFIGKATLDRKELCSYRTVITNYDTIVNYQYSFATLPVSWSVIVTDEAQQFKNAMTKRTLALKSLKSQFRIACTGTPVETRLADIWNIFDFLDAGNIFGSEKEFTQEYEIPLRKNPERQAEILDGLRGGLRYRQKMAHILRREKEGELLELPPKYEHVISCVLSEEQSRRHREIASTAQNKLVRTHPFEVLTKMFMLYQHPALVKPGHFRLPDADEALRDCPKLVAVVARLIEIRTKNEKALIFCRNINMQQILRSVISKEFGLDVSIINGVVKGRNDTSGGKQSRKTDIDEFRRSKGFNVLILSPLVAGIGLTIIEANHVFHYGRWWNPAQESQATDRVYRLGQTRDVNVYVPVAREANREFTTFDEHLYELLKRRQALAKDFLAPQPDEDINSSELFENTFGSTAESQSARSMVVSELDGLTWEQFEAAIAAIETKRCEKVILTQRSGDLGVDVIAICSDEIKLIQCKHTRINGEINSDALDQLNRALDFYQNRCRASIVGRRFVAVLATNGIISKQVALEAKSRGIEVLAQKQLKDLMSAVSLLFSEVEVAEYSRLKLGERGEYVLRSYCESKPRVV